MFDHLIEKFNVIAAIGWLVIVWGGVFLSIIAYHRNGNHTHNGILDLIPTYIINTAIAVLVYVGTIPILNCLASKYQYGGIVGAAREMKMFSERPWYGMGGYQFLIVVLIILVGFIASRFSRNRY